MNQVYGVTNPEDARRKLHEVCLPCESPANLEEWALANFGPDIYERLIYGYNVKQWGREPVDIPSGPLKRLPVRYTYNDKWYDDKHREGIPIGGYTPIFEKLLHGIDVRLNTDFLKERAELSTLAKKVIYSGPIDEFFDCCFGKLEYRSLRFEHESREGDFQGTAIVTYTDADVPWTRITEHKHFEFLSLPNTIITKEFPAPYTGSNEPYYPVNDILNNALLLKYRELAEQSDVIFGGRLGRYQYYDMDQTIANALNLVDKLCPNGV